MNILYLHAHDVGRFASPYGADVETPALEKFAASGATVFENAHAAAPTCSPSRAALLTGEYPHQQGMLGLVHRGFSLERPERHLANWLKTQDYTTALFGIQHEANGDLRDQISYDLVGEGDWTGGITSYDASIARKAADWIESHNGSKPFFLSVGFYWPHVPLPEVESAAPGNQIRPWPDHESGCLDTAALQAAIHHTDTCIGQVLDALESSLHREDTLVLVTTDHGLPFPLSKASLYDRGTGVLFMLRVPGVKGPPRSRALVSHLDFFPTICELTGLKAPEWLQGESLEPVLKGADTQRDSLFLQTNHHVDYEPMRAVRTRSHKLIAHFQNEARSIANVDPSRLKDYTVNEGLLDCPWPELELYDLVADPEELENLAGTGNAASPVRDKLLSTLESWMIKLDDPLAKVTL